MQDTRKPPLDLRFETPANFLLLGPTGSGKTNWLLSLLKNNESHFKNKIHHLIYFYADEDATHSKFKAIPGLNVIFHKGAPNTLEDVKDMLLQFPKEECKAVVFDDLYNDLKKYMTTLFTVTSSHQNACFFLLGQTIFKDATLRILSQNAKYLIIFKNPRDKSVYTTLGSQVAPGKASLLKRAIEMATERPYGYIVLDFHNSQHDFLRFRSNVLVHELPMVIYTI